MIAGGGAGMSVHGSVGRGGGGSGEFCFRVPYKVTSGGTVSLGVGAGGVGPAAPAGGGTPGGTGGTSFFGAIQCLGGTTLLVSASGQQPGEGGGIGGHVNTFTTDGLPGSYEVGRWSGGSSGGYGAIGTTTPGFIGGASLINGFTGGATGSGN